MARNPSFDDLAVFLAVAETGSMAAAARRLAIDPSTVSRGVGRVEEELGVALFQRTGAGTTLSEAGRRLATRVRNGVDQLTLGIDEAVRPPDVLQGTVRVTAPTEIGCAFLMPVLVGVQQRHPGIELELELGTRLVELGQREADLALRTVRPTQGDVITRRLRGGPLDVVCAPSLDEASARERFIAYLPKDPIVKELVESLPNARIVLRCNDLAGVRAACVAGLGSAVIPRPLAEHLGLVPTGLPTVQGGPMWLAAPTTSLEVPRIRAIWDAVIEGWEVLLQGSSATA
ncbi:MAG: LysR family transcriptional regulator [Myxococcota bacterium]